MPKVVDKSPEVKQRLEQRLTQAFMFSALNAHELAVVIDAIEEVKFESGAKVIAEGDQGDCMYVLESGSLDCSKVIAGNLTHLKVY